MSEAYGVTDQMADQAIAWFARLRADDVSRQNRDEFVAWLRIDRMHQVAFVEVLNLWEDLAVVKTLDFDSISDFTMLWREKEKARARMGLTG
ncbi:MAG: DUF4880 domain-containing protein [Proteobacteria bacterium]|nr:DUF4880 domain-containing protein [Pseudomonadota bacterium]